MTPRVGNAWLTMYHWLPLRRSQIYLTSLLFSSLTQVTSQSLTLFIEAINYKTAVRFLVNFLTLLPHIRLAAESPGKNIIMITSLIILRQSLCTELITFFFSSPAGITCILHSY